MARFEGVVEVVTRVAVEFEVEEDQAPGQAAINTALNGMGQRTARVVEIHKVA